MTEKQSKVQGPVMVGWGLISYVGGLRLYVGAWYWGPHIVGDVPTVVGKSARSEKIYPGS